MNFKFILILKIFFIDNKLQNELKEITEILDGHSEIEKEDDENVYMDVCQIKLARRRTPMKFDDFKNIANLTEESKNE